MVCNKNVLRLQVPVKYSSAVAVADGIQDLEKDTLGKRIIPNVLFAVCDIVEEITFGTILQDNIYAFRVVDDALHGDNVWVILDFPMCPNFPGLEFHGAVILWPTIGSNPVEGLDGTLALGNQVDSPVHDAVGTVTEDFHEAEAASHIITYPDIPGVEF